MVILLSCQLVHTETCIMFFDGMHSSYMLFSILVFFSSHLLPQAAVPSFFNVPSWTVIHSYYSRVWTSCFQWLFCLSKLPVACWRLSWFWQVFIQCFIIWDFLENASASLKYSTVLSAELFSPTRWGWSLNSLNIFLSFWYVSNKNIGKLINLVFLYKGYEVYSISLWYDLALC